jgi:hypothetical protein
MSAFVVGEGCINRVVYGLRLMDHSLTGKETELGRELLELNIEAVRQRYNDEAVRNENANCYKYEEPADIENCSPAVAAWKSTECFLYQCSEGNVPETPLFKIMHDHNEKFGQRILKKLNKFYDAVWDIPECGNAPWGD